MTTALFIDTRSRQLKVSSVSVTEARPGELVLRFGAEAPALWDLEKWGKTGPVYHAGPFKTSCPVIVPVRGYEARSSAGFVRVLRGGLEASQYTPETHVVGLQGFDHEKPALRRIGPMPVRVLPAGTEFRTVVTHSSGHGSGAHSNSETADAAYTAVVLRSQVWGQTLFLIEGQSDYTRSWAFVPPTEEAEVPAWPAEHRGDIFRTPRVTIAVEYYSVTESFVVLDMGRKFATHVWGSKMEGPRRPMTPTEALRFLVGSFADWNEDFPFQVTLTWEDCPETGPALVVQWGEVSDEYLVIGPETTKLADPRHFATLVEADDLQVYWDGFVPTAEAQS